MTVLRREGETDGENISTPEERFIHVIEEDFHGTPEVAERLLEMASCNTDGEKVTVENVDFWSYILEINCSELGIGTKTRLIFYPEEKNLWLEIYKSGEMIYGEPNIGVNKMELSENKTRIVIERKDNGKKIHLGKDGCVSVF